MNQRIQTNWTSCFQSRSRKTRGSRTSRSVFIWSCSSRTDWTPSARGFEPRASSRIVSVIFGQFFPPSNGAPFEGGKNWPKITLTMRDEALGSKPLAEGVQSVLLEQLQMKTDLEVLEPRVFRE